MAKGINGSGFTLYFPDAEEAPTNALFQGVNPTSAPGAKMKQTTREIDNGDPSNKHLSEEGTPALKSPAWEPDTATTPETACSNSATDTDKHVLREHRTSLSIPPVEGGQLTEPDQEPNFRSYLDSRRRSSQLAEGWLHATSRVSSAIERLTDLCASSTPVFCAEGLSSTRSVMGDGKE